jgi:phosphatidylglycerol:prolipoprotein diacylglycerol transferase
MLPILYHGPELTLYSYPLLMGLGWGVAYQVYFAALDARIPRWKGQVLFWGIFLSAWVGAKLLFSLTAPAAGSLLGTVSFWTGGGFVFYGGFLAGALFLLLCRFADPRLRADDLWPVLPALALGHGIGRIGCFLAGCCFGRETELLWGIHLHGADRHPTQLIEALALIGLGTYLLRSRRPRGELFLRYLIVYGVVRLAIEGLRGDAIRGSWGPLTPSQWISLGLIVTGFLLDFKSLKKGSPFKLH